MQQCPIWLPRGLSFTPGDSVPFSKTHFKSAWIWRSTSRQRQCFNCRCKYSHVVPTKQKNPPACFSGCMAECIEVPVKLQWMPPYIWLLVKEIKKWWVYMKKCISCTYYNRVYWKLFIINVYYTEFLIVKPTWLFNFNSNIFYNVQYIQSVK